MSPFAQRADDSIAAWGEKQLLHHVVDWLGDRTPPPPIGIGDDAAALRPAPALHTLITTDSVVFGRHFNAEMDPYLVGGKLLRRNLSDIAAMGGLPQQAVIAAFLPAHTAIAWLRRFYTGLADCARHFIVEIVGGDMAQTTSDLAINMTLLGHADRLLTRCGGQIGDTIAVTGPLGASFPERHLIFTPKLAEGQLLAKHSGVTAAMDISDGLGIDLLALLPDNASALLHTDRIPIHPDATTAAVRSGRSPIWHACNDGEDHELLFLADPTHWQSLCDDFIRHALPPPIAIGSLGHRAHAPILCANSLQPLADCSAGYDHFH